MVSKRRARINREIMDAMNPDGPTNPTRRGTRLANKALKPPRGGKGRVKSVKEIARTKPTAANKAAAEKANKALVKRNKMYPEPKRSTVYNSKKVPTWGTPKPPTINKAGKRVSAVVGDTRTHKYYKGKPVIKSVARRVSDQPIRRPAPGGADVLKGKRLPTNPVERRIAVRSNARALSRQQSSRLVSKMAKPMKAAKVLKPLARGLSRATGPVGIAAAFGAEAIYKGVKRATSPGGKEFHGQFVDYTSKPTNRGKRGVNY